MADKFRNWSFVLFPEGDKFTDDELAAAYKFIRERHIPFVAILHSPESGEKKWHLHIACSYDSPKKREFALSDYAHPNIPTAGKECFIPVASITGLETYFLHWGESDKNQYKYSELVTGNGYKLHIDDDGCTTDYLRQLVDYAITHSEASMRDIAIWCRNELPAALPVLSKNSFLLREILGMSSSRNKGKQRDPR